MRISLSASVVALAMSGALAHLSGNGDAVRRRKTLGFGPDLPHAVFNTSPEQFFMTAGAQSDPFKTAAQFAINLLNKEEQRGMTFKVREDSYTDDNTGVTHVYLRQVVNGLEVADGDMNINVKDGKVLSYGDSFYRGPAPESMYSPAVALGLPTPWERHCIDLSTNLQMVMQANGDMQKILGGEPESVDEHRVHKMTHLYQTNCWGPSLVSDSEFDSRIGIERTPADLGSPTDAVLRFMVAATPNEELMRDIMDNYDAYVKRITSTTETHFSDDGTYQTSEYLHNVPDTVNPVKAHLAYVQVPYDDKTALSLVWKLEAEMQDNWYEAAVTAHHPHKIVSVVDWASDASDSHIAPTPKKPKKPTRAESATYNVFAWGVNDPESGVRTIEKEGTDKLASPLGWHVIPASSDPNSAGQRSAEGQVNNYTTTWGNNVFAHENWAGRNNWEENYRPDAGPSLVFNYTYNPHEDTMFPLEEAKAYINATVTQLFYTVNLVHDLYYRYGFDEKSGNFQQDNFGRGGKGDDAVIANAQDGSGFNNANFMTPPDGQKGRCRMYIWNTASPYRDGDLEAGIVIHELSHGLSTRLTGGPANSGCLGWGESGGMGEGWGDFLATVIRSTSNYSDYPMGAWAANRPTGIRNYVYSLNDTINPSTYKTLDKPGYWGVHAIGEVWAEILWIVAQRLINKHGYTDTLFPPLALENGTVPEGDFYKSAEYDFFGNRKPLVPKHGNSLVVQLVIDGMKLQKCMPSFFDARDAIIQADQVLTGGENFCDLWFGFAERGLGEDAKVEGRTPWGGGIRTNGFKVPKACRVEEPEPEDPAPGDGDDDDDDDDDDDEEFVWIQV